jgi:4-hydroxybutyryl-CoA dehydratase/vinylacetyl-CoA-Delta-isomerase
MVELIKIVEGFFARGVAASVYGVEDPSGAWHPEPIFANVGKLLLATQIYDMHRIAHKVSGGLIVALPGPDEDHNLHTVGDLATILRARADVPHEKRIEVARLLEDVTASNTAGWMSVISLHGGRVSTAGDIVLQTACCNEGGLTLFRADQINRSKSGYSLGNLQKGE